MSDTSTSTERADDTASRDGNVTANEETNPYLRKLQDSCSLLLRNPGHCLNIREEHGESGLFHMFISHNFVKCLRQWTNDKIATLRTTERPVQLKEMYVFFGVTMFMSILRLRKLSMYWSSKYVGLTPIVGQYMSRDRYTFIRSNIQYHPPSSVLTKSSDPLYHSRIMMEEVFQNSSSTAIPQGCFALDENSIPTKARTRALSYQKDKPDSWAIRLYALVSHSGAYLYSCWDNMAAKKSQGLCGAVTFAKMFPDVSSLYDKHVLHNDVGVDPESSSALWTIMMTQPVLRAGGTNKKHTFFTDSYYTRPALAKLLYDCTDGNATLIGTIKMTYLTNVNRKAMKMAIDEMKNATRGSWVLLQVLVEKEDRTEEPTVMKRAGIIVFKDKRPVSFFTNDLRNTPTKRVMVGTDKEAIKCVRGLATMKRWMGNERLLRTPIQAPVVVVAYNMFMNSVDRFDQIRATVPNIRRERRVTSSIFAFLMDASVHNAHAVSKKLGDDKRSISDFKSDLALQLMKSAVERPAVGVLRNPNFDDGTYQAQKATVATLIESAESHTKSTLEGLGCIKSPHQLVELRDDKHGRCFLCALTQGQNAKKSQYGCLACKKAFHVNCFSQYHGTSLGNGHIEAVNVVSVAAQSESKKRAFSSITKLLPEVEDVTTQFTEGNNV
jgi:hypothetical protein